MAPIGSVLKNTIVYIVIMGISVFAAVNYFLVNAFVNLVKYADSNNVEEFGRPGLIQAIVGVLILFSGFGLALNMTLPSIVGDELVEF